MKSNYKNITIKVKEVLDDRQFIIPTFQRSLVWNKDRRRKFIDNVRSGDPFGVMLVQTKEDGKYEIIDGLQRVTTLKDYYNNKFDYLGPDVLDEELLQKTLKLNLKAQGVNLSNNPNYYRDNSNKLRMSIYNSLKNNFTQMKVITTAVDDLGLMPNNDDIMQSIIDICNDFDNASNIDDLEITAINYFGPKQNIPSIFYNLNTGAVSLTKYETYAALWSDTNYRINDKEILDKVIMKYQALSEDSDLEVDYDEDLIREQGISLFEYCFALGQIIKGLQIEEKFITNSKDNVSKTDPSGFELLTLVLGEQINNAEKLYDKLKNCDEKFLVKLKNIIKDACKTVFEVIKPYVIGLNGKSLLTDSDYLLYHMVVSYIWEYYHIDSQTGVISKRPGALPEKDFKKYAPYVYLHDIFIDFWKVHRQVGDLSSYLKDDSKRHQYWSKVSEAKWTECFVQFFESQSLVTKSIPKSNKLFIDLYTKLNLQINHPELYAKFIDFNKDVKEIKLDYEHITPKKRIQNKIGGSNSKFPLSRIGNLCYLSIKDNRSKGELTLYEFIATRASLNVSKDYLDVVDYPEENELSFIDYPPEEFVEGYNTFIKNRENRLEKNIVALLKAAIDK